VAHHSLQLASNRPQHIDKVDESLLPRVGIITTDLQATAAAIENVAGLQQVMRAARPAQVSFQFTTWMCEQ